MLLVDTSIWIDHIRNAQPDLIQVLDARQALIHPAVLGEVALGSLKTRSAVLDALGRLPAAVVAHDIEVLHFIERHALSGTGIGFVDAHLLASASLTPGALLWTRDVRLRQVADRLGLGRQSEPT